MKSEEVLPHLDQRSEIKSWVSENGLALVYAKAFRADREIVSLAVEENSRAFQYASSELRADAEMMWLALSSHRYNKGYLCISLFMDLLRLEYSDKLIFIALSTCFMINELYKEAKELIGPNVMTATCYGLHNFFGQSVQSIEEDSFAYAPTSV